MAEAPVARVCPFNGDTARASAAPLPAKMTMTGRSPGVWSVIRGRSHFEIAVGQRLAACSTIRAVRLLPPSGVARCGSSIRLPVSLIGSLQTGANSVPTRSIACMMIPRR
jgi:hypothetical protein